MFLFKFNLRNKHRLLSLDAVKFCRHIHMLKVSLHKAFDIEHGHGPPT